MLTSLGLLAVFIFFSLLMICRQLPAMLALPCLALAVAMLVGVHHQLSLAELGDLLANEVLGKGGVAMARSVVVAIFGGALAQLVTQQGITRDLVARAAEYGGDHKLGLGLIMLAVVVVNFTAMSGVAAILLVGNLVLPLLVSVGFSPRLAGTLMLFGVALGNLINPVALQIFMDIFHVDLAMCLSLSIHYMVLLGIFALAYLVVQLRRERRFAWAVPCQTLRAEKVRWWALLTPVVPLVLMGPLSLAPLPAILLALLYGALAVRPRDCLNTLSRSLIEGTREVAPVIVLFVGLGMALEAFRHPLSQEALGPVVAWLAPRQAWSYVLGFTLLAPLATYRGPLTLYGLGSGVAVLLIQARLVPVTALLAAFLCLAQVQSISDPTCTHTVCVAQMVKESPENLALHSVAWVWFFVLVALSWAVWGQQVFSF